MTGLVLGAAAALPDFGALPELPDMETLAAEFDRAAAVTREASAYVAREAALYGEMRRLELRDDKLELAELIGFEADRYASAAALIRRFTARAHAPNLQIRTLDHG